MIEAYKYVFSQPGALTAPINYYRCMFKQKGERKGAPKAIETPTLIIWVSDVIVVDIIYHDRRFNIVTYALCSAG